ncbi:MAG: NAD-binding protein [Nitrospinaceae bacterium]
MYFRGGGPIGVELSQYFSRLGSKVTLIEMMPNFLIREDDEISYALRKSIELEGVDIHIKTVCKETPIKAGTVRLMFYSVPLKNLKSTIAPCSGVPLLTQKAHEWD